MQSAVRQKKPYMSDNIIYKKIIFEKIQNFHSIIQLNSYFNVFVKNKTIFFLESWTHTINYHSLTICYALNYLFLPPPPLESQMMAA